MLYLPYNTQKVSIMVKITYDTQIDRMLLSIKEGTIHRTETDEAQSTKLNYDENNELVSIELPAATNRSQMPPRIAYEVGSFSKAQTWSQYFLNLLPNFKLEEQREIVLLLIGFFIGMPLLAGLSNGVFVLYLAFYFMFLYHFSLRFADSYILSQENKAKLQIKKYFDLYLIGGLFLDSLLCGIASKYGDGKFITVIVFFAALAGAYYYYDRYKKEGNDSLGQTKS